MTFKILVVEDDLASAELIQEILTREGASVTVCTRPLEAARLIAERLFDGIFLDLHMPGFDGWELTQMVRASSWNHQTPVMIVSGSPRDAMNKAFAAGATLFLAKPVDQRKLVQAFRSVRSAMLAHRRRFVRLPFTAEIACRNGSRDLRLRSDNLSVGGMLLRSDHQLQTGDQLGISFSLENGQQVVVARARVVRVDEHGRAALRFEALQPGHDLRLREFVAAAVA